MKRSWAMVLPLLAACVVLAAMADNHGKDGKDDSRNAILGNDEQSAMHLLASGKQIFRFDTFGDQGFWGDQLHLNQAINGLSPRAALGLGLKVDADALSPSTIEAIKHGKVNLDDPAVTRALIAQKAVVGVVGIFNKDSDKLASVGLTCAVCHSTVDNSVAPGIGRRIDGLANRDLNVGAIVAAAPNLDPVQQLLQIADPGITVAQIRSVLLSWGPGKFDAELFLDGKAVQPNGRSAAALIPNARGLAGHNLHTWTGGWGSIPYWNAFVAVNEMHGVGTFFDERFDDASQFPIAARAQLGHVSVDPDSDQVTSKLPALQFYQLSLPALKPRPGIDFNVEAAKRGDELFSGKANCNSCHREPLWSEPGWNQHTADEMKIDHFEADRSPGHAYQTMNLAGLFIREEGLFMNPADKGRFYHDGRFQTLMDVVNSYDSRFNLGLTDQEKSDLIEYLKSL
ncbi:MAG TPA: hypothetical protein VFQ00_08710 [Terriglobales bacterium]|nr:hypothetical protein [Terriglobales bacterium]